MEGKMDIKKNLLWLFTWLMLCPFSHLFAHAFENIAPDALVQPYALTRQHPVYARLEKIFSNSRVLKNKKSLVKAGFEDRLPEPRTQVYVLRHKQIPGYIFKLYTDDQLSYYRGEPEYVTWFLRARGAEAIRHEIAKNGWQAFFKAPKKWIYKLPVAPRAKSSHLGKNYILVEEEMDLLPKNLIKQKWKDGTITLAHLDMLFFLIVQTGLRGGCKYDNIPICYDGRLAFIDTQNHWQWPLPFERLYAVLSDELKLHWQALIDTYQLSN